jgi:hypothetical protein
MNTTQIEVALLRKFPAPEYATILQVRSSTGASWQIRTADVISMSLWPSRGLELTGFEIKASRTDWLKELKEAAKAERIYKYCDRWYLVVGDKSIVQPGELPPTWGLMIPRGENLIVSVEAPKLEPVQISRVFLAALIRRITSGQSVSGEMMEQIRKSEHSRAKAALDKVIDQFKETVRKDFNRENDLLKEAIKEFEDRSGIKFQPWEMGRIGMAVHIIRKKGVSEVLKSLNNISSAMDSFRTQTEEATKALTVSLQENKLEEENHFA